MWVSITSFAHFWSFLWEQEPCLEKNWKVFEVVINNPRSKICWWKEKLRSNWTLKRVLWFKLKRVCWYRWAGEKMKAERRLWKYKLKYLCLSYVGRVGRVDKSAIIFCSYYFHLLLGKSVESTTGTYSDRIDECS